jgi:hypothetical protein
MPGSLTLILILAAAVAVAGWVYVRHRAQAKLVRRRLRHERNIAYQREWDGQMRQSLAADATDSTRGD